MKKYQNNFIKLTAVLTVALLVFIYTPAYAALSSISDTMTRQKISTLSSHTITFTASGNIPANQTIAIDFREDAPDTYFTVSGAATVAGDLSVTNGAARTIVDVDGACTGHVGTGDIAASVNDTTGVLTLLTCGSYSATTAIITINYGTAAGGANRVTNPSAKGTYVVPITLSGGLTDTGKFAVSIPEASGDDQIPVNATVNPTITFTVVNTAFALGDLSSSSIVTSGLNDLSVGTNATGGYSIKVQDAGGTGAANPGLYDSVSSSLVASGDETLSTNNEGYGGQCEVHSASGTCSFSLTSAGETVTGFTDNSWLTFASYGSKPSATDVFHIRVKASITTATTAGYYQDTLTLVATGNF
jgi:hypothetical protein